MRLGSTILMWVTYWALFLSDAEGNTQIRGDPNDDFMFDIPDGDIKPKGLGEGHKDNGNILNLPREQMPEFLKTVRQNFDEKYSHHNYKRTILQKFSKMIAYLEDLRWSRSLNINDAVQTTLRSLQDKETDRVFREELKTMRPISTKASDVFRGCVEDYQELPSLADADYNFVEEMMSSKVNRLPPEKALPAIRNLTATMDSQRFHKISNTLLCVFQSVVHVLGGTSEKECKAGTDIKPVPSYITAVEGNTIKALNTTIALRTLTASVDTALKFYSDGLASITSAVFNNTKPALEVAPDGKTATLYVELSKCLEKAMSNAVKCSKFPDADVSQGTTGIPSMREFAEHVGRMRYFSIIFDCHLKVVERRRMPDQYIHPLSDLHVWHWYEEGAYREMDVDTEYESDDDGDHSHNNYNHDHQPGEAFEQISDQDLELSMDFDPNHRLHVHPHHKNRGQK